MLDFAAARGWSVIGESEWNELRAGLSDISESTIRGSGLPIACPWCGVAVHSIDDLEDSLREFTKVYAARPDLRRYCRDEVIAAKDRARWASLSPRVEENKRALKAEMLQWMLVWLDDPAVFPVWAQLRRNALSGKNTIH